METHNTFIVLQKISGTISFCKFWMLFELSKIVHTYGKILKELYIELKARVTIGKIITDEFVVSKELRSECIILSR